MKRGNEVARSMTSTALLIKYILDVLFGFISLLIFLPFFLIISIAIKLDSQGPVFFKQRRVGKGGNQFNVYKFRTMVDNAINIGSGLNIIDNDPRITNVGKFLRDWSLDELPQIINIVKGDMSFIGPRPTLQYQVDNYNANQRKRLNMKPGLTGWSQVNGRNNIPWENRIELDVWYVENWSLWLDVKILFRTPKVILAKEDVYSDKGISYDFDGTEKNKTK